ncbi:hypothetical protein CRG86_007380 [Photobacterium leiognathi]|nr:hypothetical protein CRG86_007380 [Photobacterium leiognathi]
MNIDISDFIAVASAVAAIASAYAAFAALRISRESAAISKASSLAGHHGPASLAYTKVVNEFKDVTHDLYDCSSTLLNRWGREIESKDHRSRGGVNPRPLRHVLCNGYMMTMQYGLSRHSMRHTLISVLQNGMYDFSETEYQKLLSRLDNTYDDVEGVLGTPSTRLITQSSAFRWICYQLIKRISHGEWQNIWRGSWDENGWLTQYQNEYVKVKPVLEAARKTLLDEKARLEHTALPLSKNTELFNKYNEAMSAINNILECSDMAYLQAHDSPILKEEYCLLVLCAMTSVQLTYYKINQLNGFDDDC